MHVRDILRSKGNAVVGTVAGATVAEAVHRLNGPPRVGALVVLESGGKVVGLLTERDVVRGLAERHAEFADLTVADLMSRSGPVCAPEDTIASVMQTMTRTRYRHVPVLQSGQLVGLVSIGDLVKNRLEELQLESDVLRDVYIGRR